MSTLAQIAADLANAAGGGGTRLGQEVAASGKTEAEVGAAVRSPGPGLIALVGHRRAHIAYQSAEGSQEPLEQVTQTMATRLADGGVDLALGRRR